MAGKTYIDHNRIVHSYNAFKHVYELRVEGNSEFFFDYTHALITARNHATDKYALITKTDIFDDIEKDIREYSNMLDLLKNQILGVLNFFEDVENGFKATERYNKVSANIAFDRQKWRQKTDKHLIKLLKTSGFHSKSAAVVMAMAKNPNAKKTSSSKSLITIPYEKEIEQKNTTITNKDKEIENQKSQNTAKDQQIAEKDQQIAEKNQQIAEKDQQIQELNNRSSEDSGEEQESSGTSKSYSSGGDSNSGGESSSTQESSSAEPEATTEPENTEESAKTDPVNPTSVDPEESTAELESESSDDEPIKIKDPEDSTPSSSKKSNVIPAVLGVGAAGAAGFAGVRYIKNKNKDNYNTDNYDEEEGSDDVDYSYSDDNNGEENYSAEKYSAGNKDKDSTPVNNDSNNLSLDEDEEIKIEDDYQDDFNEELE